MPTYALNKKARFDYEILEDLEVGLVLTGPEVKSIRGKHVKLTGSFVTIHDGQLCVTNMHISPYAYAPNKNYDPTASRILLASKKEIAYLQGKLQEKGLTIVPLSLYTKGRHIKMKIGVARGKKNYDKKRVIKERELDREARRAIKDIM